MMLVSSSISVLGRECHERLTSPPRGPEIEQDRDLEQRVADLEALIEEARRRARRRRTRRGAAALLLVAGGVVAFIGFGGHGGGGAGSAATAHARSSQGSTANAESPPLAALPADASVSAFAFDPRNPKIVYVGTGVNNSSKSHVYKSTDAGAHWQLVSGPGWIWLGALASDPKHPGTLYASTSTGIYKTTDGGRTWQTFSRGLLPAGGEGWGRLAVDPNNSNIIYAGLGGGVHKSVDAGHTWQTVLRYGGVIGWRWSQRRDQRPSTRPRSASGTGSGEDRSIGLASTARPTAPRRGSERACTSL